jgi:hypothetical protein
MTEDNFEGYFTPDEQREILKAQIRELQEAIRQLIQQTEQQKCIIFQLDRRLRLLENTAEINY